MMKGWRIASGLVKVTFGVAGVGSAAIGIVACFSPVDWPLGALLVLIGSTVFSVAAGVLHKKLYLAVIPAVAIAGCYPFLLPLPWVAVKWVERHYRLKTGRTSDT